MTESSAREEVERKAQTALEPALDASEIAAALAGARRFSTWEAGKAYEYGERVVPTVKNGKRYKAVQGGTSGASEPSWGTVDYSRVSDGGVVWEEDGMAGQEWDVGGAVYACLATRLAKATEYSGGDEGRIRKGIESLMRLYRPVGVA